MDNLPTFIILKLNFINYVYLAATLSSESSWM